MSEKSITIYGVVIANVDAKVVKKLHSYTVH